MNLDFKSEYNDKSSKCLREIKYNRYFLCMSVKACKYIFQGHGYALPEIYKEFFPLILMFGGCNLLENCLQSF